MRDIANLLMKLALTVGVLVVARLVFDLSTAGVLGGGAAGLVLATAHYVRVRREKRATLHGADDRPEG
ncbi:hypothetical protein ACX80J_14660 [Arthrobacter sp. MDB2-24]